MMVCKAKDRAQLQWNTESRGKKYFEQVRHQHKLKYISNHRTGVFYRQRLVLQSQDITGFLWKQETRKQPQVAIDLLLLLPHFTFFSPRSASISIYPFYLFLPFQEIFLYSRCFSCLETTASSGGQGNTPTYRWGNRPLRGGSCLNKI